MQAPRESETQRKTFGELLLQEMAEAMELHWEDDPDEEIPEAARIDLVSAMKSVTFIGGKAETRCAVNVSCGNEQFEVSDHVLPCTVLSIGIQTDSGRFDLVVSTLSESRSLAIHNSTYRLSEMWINKNVQLTYRNDFILNHDSGLVEGMPNQLKGLEHGDEVFTYWLAEFGEALARTFFVVGAHRMFNDDFVWVEVVRKSWLMIADAIENGLVGPVEGANFPHAWWSDLASI